MKAATRIKAGAIAIISTSTAILVLYDAPGPQVYLYGSSSNTHDQAIAAQVNASVSYGLYCTSEAEHLIDANTGDVAITGRADSYPACRYQYPDLESYPIVGGGNYAEYVGDTPEETNIFVSNGYAYGHRVDYYLPGNLGDAMAAMANILIEVNEATSTPMYIRQMKEILYASSDGEKRINGEFVGNIINVERAKEYASNGIPAPEPCNDCGWMPGAIYYLLLLE